MKKIILALLLAISIQNTFSQTATSVQNGPWLSPSTWNCGCIPIMNYSVVINHTVTLNTSMSFTSATSGLNIGSNGALLQDANRDILINGGSFTNNGKFNVRFFYTESTPNTAMNAGTMTLSAFTNSTNFLNSDTIIVDSITNAFGFQNNGFLKADSLTNKGYASNITASFFNQGTLSVKWSTNSGYFQNFGKIVGIAHTNNVWFQNSDSIVLSQGLWNIGTFENHATVGAPYISLGGGFYNYNPSTHSAIFQNDGKVIVLDSWYNTDTVSGTGSFSVQDSSANSGYMKGSFDFCDHSQITPGEIVDYNTGSISPNITTCGQVGIEKYSNETKFNIYPNPANSILNINVSSSSEVYRELNVYDVLGKSILKSEIKNQNSAIDVSSLPSGMYCLKIGNTSQKFIKQ